jgi:two-component system chemotaxis sensor kinase CheA
MYNIKNYFHIIRYAIFSLFTSSTYRELEIQRRSRIVFINIVLLTVSTVILYALGREIISNPVVRLTSILWLTAGFTASLSLFLYLRSTNETTLPSVVIAIASSISVIIASSLAEVPFFRGNYISLIIPVLYFFLFEFHWGVAASIIHYYLQVYIISISITSTISDADVLAFLFSGVVVVIFLAISHAIRYGYSQTLESTAGDLMRQKAQSESILNNIPMGIGMLVSRNNQIWIEESYSKSLVDLLNVSIKQGPFIDILSEILPSEMLEEVEHWLTHFAKGKRFRMLMNTNPLAKVETTIESHSRLYPSAKRILAFTFSRTDDYSSERQTYIFTVTDITDHELQQHDIAKERDERLQQNLKFEQLLSQRPENVFEFIEDTGEEIAAINALLKGEGGGDEENPIPDIFQLVHAIKGNARLLRFNAIAYKLHEFEETLKPYLSGKPDFMTMLGFIERIAAIQDEITSIKRTLNTVSTFAHQMNQGHTRGTLLTGLLQSLIKQECEIQGKSVFLDADNFDSAQIPETLRKIVKDILVVLVRNSIAHGIEASKDRVSLGKKPHGTISLESRILDTSLEIVYRDDGASLDIEAIKDRGIAMGLLQSNREYAEQDIVALIFSGAFSTKKEADITAGRGVGLSAVYSLVKAGKVQLRLRFRKGMHTTFLLKFPLKDLEEAKMLAYGHGMEASN